MTCRLIIIALLLATAASAYTVALPGLTGSYEGDPYAEPNFDDPYSRSQVFTLPAEVTAVDQLELVLTGVWHHGELGCMGAVGWEIVPWEAPVSLSLRSDAWGVGQFMWALAELPDGPFDEFRASFQFSGGLTPGDLLGVELTAELFVENGIIGICAVETDVYGEFSDVLLDIQGTVPADGASWTAVKSLFR